ncbi:hypothetical protein VN97_g8987 [Penicillium thymicola]|uniref:Uncharacterized protein n=1 Tax=Penicillium thymicola TaxID=293382 RepID=A0AAI9X5Q5_PENTH|nr:hypothetical protein VN97_g8987 [Penicillium thymicola]
MSNTFEVEETVTIRLHTHFCLRHSGSRRGKSRLKAYGCDFVLGHKEHGWTLYAPKHLVSPCNCESQCPWTLRSLAVHLRETLADNPTMSLHMSTLQS